MKVSRNLIFLVGSLLILVELGNARPSRGLKKKAKGKRSWSDSAVPVAVPEIVFPSPLENDAIPELGVVEESSSRGQGGKWLELDRSTPAIINAPINSDITLECVATGSPPPRVLWLKDGKPIDNGITFDADPFVNQVFDWNKILKRSGGNSEFSMSNTKIKLPLKCVRPEDQGVYTCVAENDGKQHTATTTVIVDDTLPVELKSECSFHHGKKGRKHHQGAFIMSYEYLHMETIGNDAVLSCNAVGRPRPKVTWFDIDGKPIISDKKFRVTEAGNLIVRNLSWKEMGEYTCQAENDYGSDSASAFLYPLLSESSR